MFTYRVEFNNTTYKIIEAEYFEMLYDGVLGVDAYFYVTRVDAETPEVTHKILVGYAHHPEAVIFDDQWVPTHRSTLDGGLHSV